MKPAGRFITRLVVAASFVPAFIPAAGASDGRSAKATAAGDPPVPAPASSVTPPAAEQVAAYKGSGVRPGVRLRKLHLVRPDLIPYPIAYEVYC